MDILDRIIKDKLEEVARTQQILPLDELKKQMNIPIQFK